MNKPKFIFITGGVLSSLGKGLAAASIAALMEMRGLKITLQKLDPYINIDPGTMSPFQHGEVYVTDDGAETDLDLGHYERFAHAKMSKKNNFTSGSVYYSVIDKERKGKYLGATVQVIPHITDEIKSRIFHTAENIDMAIIEVGGTVGDIESLPFLEAIRQFRNELGSENVLYIHLTLVPYLQTTDELKTKPTQHSVKELRGIGIQPDILLCRTQKDLDKDIKNKIANFCNIKPNSVIADKDVNTIYEMPLALHKENLDQLIVNTLNIWTRKPVLDKWEDLVSKINNPEYEVKIAIVGKYTELKESYKSLHEALIHGGIANNARVILKYVEADDIAKVGGESLLNDVDGILVPGGFGERGFDGKIKTIYHARVDKIPFFGICLGMQLAVIEFARNVAGIKDAHSIEVNKNCNNPVIFLMSEWFDYRQNKTIYRDKIDELGGTMRLGSYPCILDNNSLAHKIYQCKEISERHRHRYEFNNNYRDILEKKGLAFTGTSPDGKLVEIIEVPDHPWFLCCQFHPEFCSRPMEPHPLFNSFIANVLKFKLAKL